MSQKITLYTNHHCPWAQRAHIALQELGLEFEEVIIDITVPREPWYLEINPRGTVPSLKFGDEIIPESAIIATFLVDAFPSHLVPSPGNPEAALKRARINFFVDTFVSKIVPNIYGGVRAEDETEKAAKAQVLVDNIEKEIAPLLANAGPFFGGSKQLTLAEVLTGSFVLRIYAFSKAGLLPTSIVDKLSENKTWQSWADAVRANESVVAIFDEEENVRFAKERMTKGKK
ncbi:hypothetical protein RUND412_000466 [Rhizina undulata]